MHVHVYMQEVQQETCEEGESQAEGRVGQGLEDTGCHGNWYVSSRMKWSRLNSGHAYLRRDLLCVTNR